MEKVSVVLCTYNGERFLREQLDSVLAQTYPLHEVIVQDDGTTDDTVRIAHEYANHYPQIKVYINEGEHGINGNFYSAMRRATGTLIAICDQDDIWEPCKLAVQVEIIGNRLLCGGRSKPFSEDGSFVYYDMRMPNITLFRMLYCAEMAGHTMLVRRELLDRLPKCRVVSTRCYDIVFSVLAAALDSVIFVDRVLVHQRRYATASTYTSIENSLPTASNAWNLLQWCWKNYGEVKRRSRPIYQAWEELLTLSGSSTKDCQDAIHMMQLEQQEGVVAFVRLVRLCVCHRNEILHTRGRFPINVVRAMLFPLTSCYYQRALLSENDR